MPPALFCQATMFALGAKVISLPQQQQSSGETTAASSVAHFSRRQIRSRMLKANIMHVGFAPPQVTCLARAHPALGRPGARAGRARVQTEKQAEPARHMANSSANITRTMTSIWRSIVLRLDGGSVAFFITCRRGGWGKRGGSADACSASIRAPDAAVRRISEASARRPY
jgi:hypothetical protein